MNMRYLPDSNFLIALMNDNAALAARMREHSLAEFGLSAMVLYELCFGAYNSNRVEKNLQKIRNLNLPVLPFTAEDARVAGHIRATLKKQGNPIGPYDILIAAQALTRNLTLITHNTREFARVEGLRVEDWL